MEAQLENEAAVIQAEEEVPEVSFLISQALGSSFFHRACGLPNAQFGF
jgi:hypothetical protein